MKKLHDTRIGGDGRFRRGSASLGALRRCFFPVILICLFLCGCQSDDGEDYNAQLRLNINHIDESDKDKDIHIAYPVFGGIDDKEVVTIINSSIYNFVNSEYEEFKTALISSDQDVLANGVADQNSGGDEDEDEDDYSDEEEDEDEDGDESEDEDEDSASEEDGENSDETDADENGGIVEAVSEISMSMNFKITYNKNNFLCVVQMYDKDLGNDLKFTGQRSFFFSLENATYLSLGDIFNFDSGFADYANEKIRKQLENGVYTTYEEDSGFTGISKNCKFYIDTKHLYLFYDALEISPDKDVIPTFAFPAGEVKKYVNEGYENLF